MANNHNNSLNSSVRRHVKNKHSNELNQVFEALFQQPQTMKELDRRTGIMRESICRYCANLRKQGRLYYVRRRRCRITGYPHVWELTTDPAKAAKESIQLALFSNGF